MATIPLIAILRRHLSRSALLREGEEKTDGQLLEAFRRRQDSLALEVLVRRHAPMVWGVCRRALANHHDAEDAFQTTFLVLVRKAGSIRSRDLLANWLYRVAYNTARKARQMKRPKPVDVVPEPKLDPHDPELGPELRALLDEELSRLPDRYRTAVVLCDLEGLSRSEAAEQLRLPEGTVASRLARGRAMLAKRLLRRGVGVSATALAAMLPHQAASGSVPAALLATTIKITTLAAAGEVTAAGAISAQVSILTEGALRTMALAKYKRTCVLFLMATLMLAGWMVTYHALANYVAKTEPPPGKPNEANAEADIKQYGTEADARRVAEKRVADVAGALSRIMVGRPEVREQIISLSWNEAAAKQIGARLPDGCACGSLEAKLDREKGHWTVHGVYEIHGPDPKVFEVDWTLVVKCSPSTGRWEPGDEGPRWFTANGEVPHPAKCGLHPVEYGLRPVVKKVAKGGG
jgi:RNA polymerase sigma factor (sigma-70 family)